MNNEMKISLLRIKDLGDVVRLEADIEIENQIYTMYYEVEAKYGQYFVTEVSDAYLVCLLLYAMENGYDMTFEGDLSEILYIQLNEYLIPAITDNIKQYRKIKITARALVNIQFQSHLTATGISCGVDSFYTVLKNINHSQESGLNLNAMTFFNAGASGENGGEEARRIFKERAELASKVAQKLQCEFITVDSNMNEFLRQDHEQTHVFRTLSIPLAMQKLFKIYYFSSGMEYKLFSFEYYAPAFYDILTMPLLSTQNTKFVLVGGETTRIGKVKFIANSELAQNHLNVCVADVCNCSKCHKCKRTMLDLYVIHKLENFKNVFDLDHFYKNKRKFIRWALIFKNSVDMGEIVEGLKKNKEIKISDRIYAFIARTYLGVRRILSVLKRKVLKK